MNRLVSRKLIFALPVTLGLIIYHQPGAAVTVAGLYLGAQGASDFKESPGAG